MNDYKIYTNDEENPHIITADSMIEALEEFMKTSALEVTACVDMNLKSVIKYIES